ncbi:hypothetical protein K439DRAFT_1625470 [Ramaria rubella]|nr:hypothetical protein K439DRAFT_1625470 [Ramaria rubella]
MYPNDGDTQNKHIKRLIPTVQLIMNIQSQLVSLPQSSLHPGSAQSRQLRLGFWRLGLAQQRGQAVDDGSGLAPAGAHRALLSSSTSKNSASPLAISFPVGVFHRGWHGRTNEQLCANGTLDDLQGLHYVAFEIVSSLTECDTTSRERPFT